MRKYTTQEFMNLVYAKYSGITIIGKYTNKQTKVHCICNHCGKEFLRKSSLLLRPSQTEFNGCRKCVSKYFGIQKVKYTHDEYKNKLFKNKPHIKLLSKFVRMKDHIDTECLICGTKSKKQARMLLDCNIGCTKCQSIKMSQSKMKSHAQFVVEIIDKTITVIGEYSGGDNKINMKCDKCSHIWSPRAGTLLEGNGCPICAKNGFNTEKPAQLYLYNIDDLYIGFGITGDAKTRHALHRKSFEKFGVDYELIHTFYFEVGLYAREIETIIKRMFIGIDTGIPSFRKEAVEINKLDILLETIDNYKKGL